MGVTKTETYEQVKVDFAHMLKAIGHPARLAIIEAILETKACVCGDLVKELPLSQATVSQHLKALKEAGIIQGTIEGTSVCYCINPDNFTSLVDFLNELKSLLPNANSCC